MYQHNQDSMLASEDFAALGNDFIAYMREIPGAELADLLPQDTDLEEDRTYWVLFAADGQPLMVSDQSTELLNGAFYNDLEAIFPN